MTTHERTLDRISEISDPTIEDIILARKILVRLGYAPEPNWQREQWIAEEICNDRKAQQDAVRGAARITLTREILASALCDAVNWPGTWEVLHREAQTSWRHRADKVIHELAQREHVVVAIAEMDPHA